MLKECNVFVKGEKVMPIMENNRCTWCIQRNSFQHGSLSSSPSFNVRFHCWLEWSLTRSRELQDCWALVLVLVCLAGCPFLMSTTSQSALGALYIPWVQMRLQKLAKQERQRKKKKLSQLSAWVAWWVKLLREEGGFIWDMVGQAQVSCYWGDT